LNNSAIFITLAAIITPFSTAAAVCLILAPWGLTKVLPLALTKFGQIVGSCFFVPAVGDNGEFAFLYSGGQMQFLNNLLPPNSGWILREASSINDAGQIVGWGRINGLSHAFLLTPVP
jgi:hypothetical protein